MKVFLQLDTPLSEVSTRIDNLLTSGTNGLFTFEGRHDVFIPLAIAASSGCGLDLMTNVAIAMPRSPLHLAHAAWDLQLLSGGRFRLGLGSQVRAHIERRYGATWTKPVAKMRESVLAIREILTAWDEGRQPKHEGEFFTHTLSSPNFSPGPHPFGRPPVLMGALGPLMTRAAAEVADGLLVMPFNSRRHLEERTFPEISRGLDRGEREADSFEIIPQVVVALGSTPERLQAAREGARKLLAFYASTPAYTPVLESEGCPEVHEQVRTIAREGNWESLEEVFPNDLLTRIGVEGTPREAARQVAARFGDFAETVCCYFPGYQPTTDEVRDFVEALQEKAAPGPGGLGAVLKATSPLASAVS
ncbi:TIGR03617 family F420-dependent LLM class oxidoreductase [Pimelobacter simplex]|uniref:TIGR03617 family F420-dependent LLM class oxidoreductase n=1 Tax=Nocardioides simplex TaxID=2045 RepID=UPI0019335829|nr:TIGR03617 family F420-dependent LLM class oxidoreductase [Pimelobacter simplex]